MFKNYLISQNFLKDGRTTYNTFNIILDEDKLFEFIELLAGKIEVFENIKSIENNFDDVMSISKIELRNKTGFSKLIKGKNPILFKKNNDAKIKDLLLKSCMISAHPQSVVDRVVLTNVG